MKQIRNILLMLLTLVIAFGSLTSCEMIESLGITLPGQSDDETPAETPNEEEKIDPANCGHYVTKFQNKVAATCSAEGFTGDKVCNACGTVVAAGTVVEKTAHSFKDGICSVCGAAAPVEEEPDDNQPEENPGEDTVDPFEEAKAEWKSQYTTITVAEALALCENFVDAASTDRYYIIATVKSVDDTAYGKLMIEDETGEIMVYGTNSADGSLKYDQMGGSLKAGDLVLIYGTLQNYKGTTKEVQNGWLIDFVSVESAPLEPTITPDSTITVAEALANAGLVAETDRFYITATVKTVSKPQFGAMILVDENGNELSVYGAYNADGTVGYASMEDKPVKGDTVTVYANLHLFNGTAEVQSAWIVSFTHNSIDESLYTEMNVAAAREAAKDSYVKVSGVVAAITYANGYVPSGFYLVDGTNAIYVYDRDAAGMVQVGNTVTVAGVKDFWILETESSSASKFGYEGCNQIASAYVLANDNGNSDFDKSWITETTVKNVMDTPVSTNITTTIFKVTALVKKAPGNGFINYYIDDLDGVTGSYVYTQCNGGDFEWLDQFDGKICTVYLSVINAKSSASGCVWRFFPVAVVDEGYVFDTANTPEFVVKYHGIDQFLSLYTGDPELVLNGSVSSELLGFENALLGYTSSDESVVYFTNNDGVITFHTANPGTATVTVTATYGDKTYSETLEITVEEPAQFDSISIADAIAKEVGEEVIVKGIVGPSVVNQDGFYLFDETGMIAIRVTDKAIFETIAIGNEVVIKGTRDVWHKTGADFGQIVISSATVEANYYGNHDYLTIDPITDKDVTYIYNLDVLDMSVTTELYHVTATILVEGSAYSSNIYISDGTSKLRLYSSSASQYSWLAEYAGQTLIVEVAPCNWNSKNYATGCVLAVYLEDGTRVMNTYNFA